MVFLYVYMTCEVGKVLLKHLLFGLKKRVGNPQLCIPTHSEALAHISFQLLPPLFKNPLVKFLSSNPLQGQAFMPIPRM